MRLRTEGRIPRVHSRPDGLGPIFAGEVKRDRRHGSCAPLLLELRTVPPTIKRRISRHPTSAEHNIVLYREGSR